MFAVIGVNARTELEFSRKDIILITARMNIMRTWGVQIKMARMLVIVAAHPKSRPLTLNQKEMHNVRMPSR